MDLQEFDSGFKKKEFVITTDDEYPQDVKFETIKDKTSLLESLSVGQAVTVHMNVKGNEYNGKYYVNLQAWKIDVLEKEAERPTRTPVEQVVEDDDLPF